MPHDAQPSLRTVRSCTTKGLSSQHQQPRSLPAVRQAQTTGMASLDAERSADFPAHRCKKKSADWEKESHFFGTQLKSCGYRRRAVCGRERKQKTCALVAASQSQASTAKNSCESEIANFEELEKYRSFYV